MFGYLFLVFEVGAPFLERRVIRLGHAKDPGNDNLHLITHGPLFISFFLACDPNKRKALPILKFPNLLRSHIGKPLLDSVG